MKCPVFTADKPELFFKLFRFLLTTQGVTNKVRQFHLVFLQLPTRVQDKCMSLLENPDDESLDKLEEETLLIFGATGEKKLQKLLTLCAAGDRTCAELLTQIRSLQDANADPNSILVKHQFFSGLPPAVQDFCSFFRGKNTLDELAAMADDFLKHKSSEGGQTNAIKKEEILSSVLSTVNALENKVLNLESKTLSQTNTRWPPNNNDVGDSEPMVNMTTRNWEQSRNPQYYYKGQPNKEFSNFKNSRPQFQNPPQNFRARNFTPTNSASQYRNPTPFNPHNEQDGHYPRRQRYPGSGRGDAGCWRDDGAEQRGLPTRWPHTTVPHRNMRQPGQCYYHIKF